MRKIIAICLSSVLALSTLFAVGCSGCNGTSGVSSSTDSSTNKDSSSGSDDSTKSVLNVGVCASWNVKWVQEAASDFEMLYAGTSFEEGKMGVEIVLDWQIDRYKPSNLLSSMERYENTLYYVLEHDYSSYLGLRLLAPMTDVVTEAVYDEDGELAVMDDGKGNLIPIGDKQATLSMMDRVTYGADTYYLEYDNNYYAAPWGVALSGMFYDADLFSQKGYFFDSKGKMGKTLADVERGNCGTGPDGKMGTADDGMPVTYNDFLALLQQMDRDEVIPFTWAGQTQYQRTKAYESVFANYEGAENYYLNFTADVSKEQLETAGVKKPYDYLALQEGRKAGIQFFYDIVKNGYYSENAFRQSGMQAGELYIKSIATDRPIAFMMGGSNWESAVKQYSDQLVKTTGNPAYAYGKRNFKVFPIPNFVGVEGIADQVNTNSSEVFPGYYTGSLAFIAAKNSCKNPAVQKHLAKLFLQFTASRTQAVKFLKNSNVMSMYEFTVKAEEAQSLTKYTQDICRYLKEGAIIVPNTEYAAERSASLLFKPTIYGEGGRAKIYYDPTTIFYENPNLTVAECFKKVQNEVRKLF